ncbi:MAG: alpha/beta fold hydrolase [Myxococcales bacterium]
MKSPIALTACLLSALHGVAVAEPADARYACPGRLVPAGDGARLNLYCTGSGSPTVVFESGWEDWSPAWATVQPRIAQWTRVCSYDRAGAGFSDPGPMPRTSVRIADELHAALHNAGIEGPYLLVGHAFGGDCVRTFADRYMPEVAGMVLEDADPTDLEPKEMQEEDHRGEVKIIQQLRECRDAVAGGKPLPMQPARPGQPARSCAQQFFRGLPEAAWSPELNAKLLELAQTKVAMYDAYLSEMEQVPWDEKYLVEHRVSLGSRPIRVLTTRNHAVGHLPATPNVDPKHLEYERQIEQAQARWLDLSTNARQIFTRNSSEYIQFDEPETLLDAIRDTFTAGTGFRDCAECPEMVVLPAGRFMMGSTPAEQGWAATHGASAGAVADEAPQHAVALRSFALARYDVTRAEYAAFARETRLARNDGCGKDSFKWTKDRDRTWQHPGFEQTDRDPVVCVSWHEARAYASWLNGKLHSNVYRLPSEAEWEYAARAGTTSRFWWGDDDRAADFAWFVGNSGGRTQPVGAKPANAFGLYDMAGDVWQWTDDCYTETYASAPAPGCMRVDRGGTWLYPSWLLRPATRERNPPEFRDAIMGFRVARTLP